jgi:circadian clock protein KaiB
MKDRLHKKSEATRAFEKSIRDGPHEYVLRLYLAGMSPRSTEAFTKIKNVCEKYLAGRYELEVVDIYQNPAIARDDQIIASPTLVKRMPAPLRRLIGDLAREDRILVGLDLKKTN